MVIRNTIEDVNELDKFQKKMGGISVTSKKGRCVLVFFFSSRRRHTRCSRDWSSDVCSSDLEEIPPVEIIHVGTRGPSSNGSKATGEVAPFVDELEQMRLALELGLHDYVAKNGFSDVVVGVSGGIDSAVTAALAAETLGPERVHCVSMPSRYSAEATRGDARRLADGLGAPFMEIPIGPIVHPIE